MTPGDGWLEFDRRLGSEWVDLATVLGIPLHVQDRFRSGHEPREIRAWLERAGDLSALPDALTSVGRGDLAGVVATAIAASRDVEAEHGSGDLPLPHDNVTRLASELVSSRLVELRVSAGHDPGLLKAGLKQEERAQEERLESLMSFDVSSIDSIGDIYKLYPQYRTKATRRLASQEVSLCFAARNAWLGEKVKLALRIARRARSDGDFALALIELRNAAFDICTKQRLPTIVRSGRSSTQFYYKVERDPEDEALFADAMALRGAVALDLLRNMKPQELDREAQDVIHDAFLGQLYPVARHVHQGQLEYDRFIDEAAWAMDNILHAAGLYRQKADSSDRKAAVVRLTRSIIGGIRKSGLFEMWRMFTRMNPAWQAETEASIYSSTRSYANAQRASDGFETLLARTDDRELVFRIVYKEVFSSVYDFGAWRDHYLP